MYRIEQHVADIRLRVSAGTVEELFRDAMRGLFAVLGPTAAPDARAVQRRISLESIDRTSVLVDFLGEVLVQAHIAKVEFTTIEFETISETGVAAIVRGVTPVVFERDVKAVTYHEAEVQVAEGEWSTMLVLDI